MKHDKGISSYRDLPIELIKDMEDTVVRKLSALTGENIEAWWFIPGKQRTHWPSETKPLIEEDFKGKTNICKSNDSFKLAEKWK